MLHSKEHPPSVIPKSKKKHSNLSNTQHKQKTQSQTHRGHHKHKTNPKQKPIISPNSKPKKINLLSPMSLKPPTPSNNPNLSSNNNTNKTMHKPIQTNPNAIKESIDAVANADATISSVKEKIKEVGDISNWPGLAAKGVGIAFNQSVNAGEKFIKSVGVDDDIRKGFNAELDFRLNAAAAGFKFISPFLPQKDKIVEPTTEVATPAPTEGQIRAFGDNAYKPLVEENPFYEPQKRFEEELIKKAQEAGEAIPEFLDPSTFNKRFYEDFVNPPKTDNKEAQQQRQEEQKQSQAVITALGEVATNLKTSTAATHQMTQQLQKGITLNGVATTTATATFA